jgi:hypothetical protein
MRQPEASIILSSDPDFAGRYRRPHNVEHALARPDLPVKPYGPGVCCEISL